MPKAYSYIRMSTPEQAKGNSFLRQSQKSEAYAKEHGLELVHLEDIGVSAFNNQNASSGNFSFFLNLVSSGKVEVGSYLIVESLDRITRTKPYKAFLLLSEIVEAGVNVVTLSDSRVYSNASDIEPNAFLWALMVMTRANEESEMKSQRIRASSKAKKERARNGAVVRQVLPAWLEYSTDKTQILKIDERCRVVASIFDMASKGWGAYSIAKRLNSDGVPTFGRAKLWRESYVKKILHSRSVFGEYQPYTTEFENYTRRRHVDGDVIRDYYPIVVDEVDFDRAQADIRSRDVSGAGRKGKEVSNLFSSILKCGDCGNSLRFQNKGAAPKGGRYLRCEGALLNVRCRASSFRYDEIEDKILTNLKEIDFTSIVGSESASMVQEFNVRAWKLEKEITKAQKEIDNLISLAKSGADIPQVTQEILVISSKLDTLKSEKVLVDERLSELLVPTDQDYEVLLAKMRDDDLDSENRLALRRNISSHLHRYINNIRLSRSNVTEMDGHYFALSDDDIEMEIIYRSGSSHHISPREGKNLYLKASEKSTDIMGRWRANRLALNYSTSDEKSGLSDVSRIENARGTYAQVHDPISLIDDDEIGEFYSEFE